MKEDRYLYYFISDVHLGLDAFNPKERERRFLGILKSLPPQTKALYLIGDIFDFWFEYKYVVPKGFTRVLGTLADLSDSGIDIYFFKGNHDMWTFGYLEEEIGLKLLPDPAVVDINGKRFCLAHGDELTSTEPKHLLLKKLFHSRKLQFALSTIHPRWTFAFAHQWSKHNRLAKGEVYKFQGKDSSIYKFAVDFEKSNKVDYFVIGHFHTPGEVRTPQGALLCVLGEWINGCEYLCYDASSSTAQWLSGRIKDTY